MKKIFTLICAVISVYSQAGNQNQSINNNNPFEDYFNQAYQQNPKIPRGMLEAVAWTQTRMTHLEASEMEGCSGYPKTWGVMGLIENGKNYFRNNLGLVSSRSGFTSKQIKASAEKSILAYAKTYSAILEEIEGNRRTQLTWENHKNVLLQLSEIPDSGIVNQFAQQSHLFAIFQFLKDPSNAEKYNFPAFNIPMQLIFPENYELLSSRKIFFTDNGIVNESGKYFVPERNVNTRSAEYGPALWTPAPSCNYSSRSGTPISAITIHTVQGTYAGAISWAQNCNSSVSYHYVVRSSDGQITQMVLEANKGWHVGSENPYTIGYEHEGYVSSPSWYTTALYNASADLSRDICNSGYGINPKRTYFGASSSGSNVLGGCTKIKGHQHYPNQTHTDPGIYWDWERYYRLINNNSPSTTLSTASGSYYDSGGSTGNYTDDERYFTLLSPTGATSVTLVFSSFSIESNWDYLYIYDGATNTSPLIGVYTGTNSPGTVTSSGGSLLIEFRSDCSTVQSGWAATWTSNATPPPPTDNIAPVTTVSVPSTWVTQDFTANFTDTDNNAVEKSFYQVIDYDGTDWRANANNGFFSDNFDLASIHAEWYTMTGNWSITNGTLEQSDESNGNTNIYAFLNHSLSNRYLYNWAGKLSGTGTNRRAGFHYFCDDPTLTNRGNSYFVWFRLDSDKIQLYKVVNDTFNLEDEVVFDFNANQWYDFKVSYDRITGVHKVYVDNVLAQTWIDPSPYSSGDYISFRSGNAVYNVNNFKVYRSRYPSVTVTVGSNGDLRYQNTNATTPAGRVKSIITDNAGNLSAVSFQDMNVDWTPPSNVSFVNDGQAADISSTTNNTELQANWGSSFDQHSDIAKYWYAIGTTAGSTDVLNWTDNYWYDTVRVTGLNLSYGTTYYFSVKAENGAGLISGVVSSNGQTLTPPTAAPVAAFNYGNTFICLGDNISLQNNSTDATTYNWSFPGGTPSTSNSTNPEVTYPVSGTYTVTLIATGPGGTDTISQSYSVDVSNPVIADFAASDTLVYLPNAFIGFTNLSTNSNGSTWDFGDGVQASGNNPWHMYTSAGTYTVTLVAVNSACPADTTTKIVYVMPPNGIDENDSQLSINIFPNPSEGITICYILSEKNCEGKITVTDVNGKIVYNSNIRLTTGMNLVTLDLTLLAAGIYHVKLDSENISNTKTMVIR